MSGVRRAAARATRRGPATAARALAVAAACLTAVSVGLAWGATALSEGPDAAAGALVARLTPPGQQPVASALVSAPPEGSSTGPLAVPGDGSAIRVGASAAVAKAVPGTSSSAEATVSALAVALLGGEVTAESLSLRAAAAAGTSGAAADTAASAITGLVVLGQPIAVTGAAQVPLADWGTLHLLQPSTEVSDEVEPYGGRAAIEGMRIDLLAEHAGLPAGTVIEVGWAEASAVAAPAPAVTTAVPATTTASEPRPEAPAPPLTAAPSPPLTAAPPPPPPLTAAPRSVPLPPVPARRHREPGPSIEGAPPTLVKPAPEVVARLSSGGYVFPVFGPASFGDSFGAYRGDVPGSWHHGEDIVAPVGTPVLAAADGTVFSVGWNAIGGWRLWLRDDGGNEFYYAHLSAYSPLATDGRRVEAGDVIGFVGTTGDAEGGIPHLHFEIHPAALLSLGHAGVVAPYPFLVAWRRAEDVSFTAGRRYVPDSDLRPGVGLPRVGAYVLEITDIGGTSGLVPGALWRALGDRAVAGRPPG